MKACRQTVGIWCFSFHNFQSILASLSLSLPRCIAPFSSRSAFLAQISPKEGSVKYTALHRHECMFSLNECVFSAVCQCTLACMCAGMIASCATAPIVVCLKKSLAFLYCTDVLRERNVEIARETGAKASSRLLVDSNRILHIYRF